MKKFNLNRKNCYVKKLGLLTGVTKPNEKNNKNN